MNKLSLRLRISLMIMLLLLGCCLLLTLIVNMRAASMAKRISADTLSLPLESLEERETQEGLEPVPAQPLSPAQVQQSLRIFSAESILAMTGVVLTGGVLAYLLSCYGLRPVKHMAKQIQRVDEYNLSTRLTVPPAGDELSMIAASFNDTADRLEKAFAAQKQFAANAAHELRTPLAVLQTQIDVFRKKKAPSASERDVLLDTVVGSVVRLSAVVHDLLALTQTDSIKHSEPLGLRSLAEDVTESLTPVAVPRQIRVVHEGEEVPVRGSYPLLYQALYNLVENAIKYSNHGGKVTVAVWERSGSAAVEVISKGSPIPKEVQEHIFEPFFRADDSRSRESGGVGLGLAIAKNILERHGGSLKLLEAAEHTTFIMELPR